MLPDRTLRRFSSSPTLSLPFSPKSPTQVRHLPEIRTDRRTSTIVRNTIKLPWSLASGLKALEAFGIAPNAASTNLGNPPLVHSNKRSSGFHVSDLWSHRQQKELLKRLEIEQSQVALRQRRQVLNYSGTSRASAMHIFASQLVRASILVTANSDEGNVERRRSLRDSETVKALVSPRTRGGLTPRKRLTTLDKFIQHLEEVIHSPRQMQELPRRRSLYQSLRIPDTNSRSPKSVVTPFHLLTHDS